MTPPLPSMAGSGYSVSAIRRATGGGPQQSGVAPAVVHRPSSSPRAGGHSSPNVCRHAQRSFAFGHSSSTVSTLQAFHPTTPPSPAGIFVSPHRGAHNHQKRPRRSGPLPLGAYPSQNRRIRAINEHTVGQSGVGLCEPASGAAPRVHTRRLKPSPRTPCPPALFSSLNCCIMDPWNRKPGKDG